MIICQTSGQSPGTTLGKWIKSRPLPTSILILAGGCSASICLFSPLLRRLTSAVHVRGRQSLNHPFIIFRFWNYTHCQFLLSGTPHTSKIIADRIINPHNGCRNRNLVDRNRCTSAQFWLTSNHLRRILIDRIGTDECVTQHKVRCCPNPVW